jgi:hypothetical protein
MCEGRHKEGTGSEKEPPAKGRLARWAEQALELARRSSHRGPVASVRPDDLLDGPQRRLSRRVAVSGQMGCSSVFPLQGPGQGPPGAVPNSPCGSQAQVGPGKSGTKSAHFTGRPRKDRQGPERQGPAGGPPTRGSGLLLGGRRQARQFSPRRGGAGRDEHVD